MLAGPGVLGSYLGKVWMERFPSAKVVGQTNSDTSHDRLRKLNIAPRTKDAAGSERFPFVVFSAPPSGSADYVSEVKAALQLWDGVGTFLYTGSAGIYATEDGSEVNECSATAQLGKDDRTDRQILVEEAVLDAGGCVVRLAGLYHAQRGAHTFFLKMAKVGRWAGYTVNLIHYEDAAELAAAVRFYRGRVFLGADGVPLTFQEMMDATIASGAYEGSVEFTGNESSNKGKLLNASTTRGALQWTPRYSSYQAFMAAGAKDWYTESGLF
ncbi:hypothetical protein COCSUDRAFT_19021 [Coccomyxa subellipsoidea C-169]|uniref:NAD(P)-binding protein n=1 Tax=Coccomyxa subellipsoidea (strain C-169) TaxID=574566 RepID=I0YN63_COCSC|nr:hypothetical protein COCSUDRAFT_19021 [Coccomyxa subellipsoidea C-169]EIE19832.1 hypothetical protein COCSUDRAFT_19021 [Coccomyxa subellipsoidea C-169]|eukprot:XP_005644376.1 hypothetical protein COCSUDRAFT_19021 [Coccomyxa subellipsoidea C-169]